MSAATTAAPPVVRSSSKRQQASYSSPSSDRYHHRTPSSSRQQQPAAPAAATTTPHRSSSEARRSTSNPPNHARATSMSQQQNLTGVARRDYEQTNLAKSSTARRSSSRDASHGSSSQTPRGDSSRGHHRNESRQTRYSSDINRNPSSAQGPPPTMRARPEGASVQPGTHDSTQARRRTTVTARTGTWTLGKTIGAGSMGKVKLGRNMETGEQVAIKIVPRVSQEDHKSQHERERADHSKEIRTAREAAIVSLLNHPYISGMRDVVRTNHHWYMLFEYINGGQMLDYIISHGRLKEKNARKFARQIASALDYCHKNSIVHRDLKIENILISKTGDIKIIDFGLSNLFAPKTQLKTFCGSLYFAAPELLQAKQYTGPEVDVWSFGIVLYVLVCGKVPFDDQNMQQLHEKIKKGSVDYPSWLSSECKSLIAKMLIKDPKQRASLHEVMTHQWMTKGFNSAPETYLPHREPLTLPLDDAVLAKMGGFDFGEPRKIKEQLTTILESDEYQHAVRNMSREAVATTPGTEKKRGMLEFYKRRNSTTSRDTLPNVSAEAVHLGSDPINAFHPLISVYYLAKEKKDREAMEQNPGAVAMPRSPGEKPMIMPDLPAPQAAYTNSNTYELPGEKPSGGRSRPRARTHGEDEIADSAKEAQTGRSTDKVSPAIVTTPAPQQQTAKKEGMTGLLRRFSTRKSREPARPETATAPNQTLQPPGDNSSALKRSFSRRKSRKESPSAPMIHSAGSQPQQTPANQLLTPPLNASGGMVSRGNKLLGRSTSVNSADYRRRQQSSQAADGSLDAAQNNDPPPTSGSDKSSTGAPRVKISEPNQSTEGKSSAPIEGKSNAPKNPASRTRSLGHARHESIQARRARRQDNVPEETDEELAALSDGNDGQETKPVYLKGLFSVSTTSSKPLPAIRAEIIRVLKQLGVEYTDIKGGFSCRHAPSIDLNTVQDVPPNTAEQQSYTPQHRRRISFGGFMGGDREKEPTTPSAEPERMQRTSSRRRRGPDASFTNSDESEDDKPIGKRTTADRTAGETTTHVQNDMGENLVLKFEIVIVKVPIFSLHGIQFKKVTGGTWQYKNMAQKILDAMRL